jgi:S-formylglutathione hydrolase FrmB
MGGHGALYLASRHPQVYCAAGSMSGAVDLNVWHWKRDNRFRRIRDSVFTVLMGPKSTADTAVPFPAYTVLERVAQIKKAKLALMLDCGTEDFLIQPNRNLHARLLAASVPHTYLEYAGKHDWEYWTKALSAQVAFAVGAMRRQD